jgi:hypothetical protein
MHGATHSQSWQEAGVIGTHWTGDSTFPRADLDTDMKSKYLPSPGIKPD